MARKAFLADVAAASQKNIPNVVSIGRGDDDGDINFYYVHENAEPVEIGLLAMGTFPCFGSSTSTLFINSTLEILNCFLTVF